MFKVYSSIIKKYPSVALTSYYYSTYCVIVRMLTGYAEQLLHIEILDRQTDCHHFIIAY